MIDDIAKSVQSKLDEVQQKIVQTVNTQYPIELAKLGKGIFTSKQTRDGVGRNWEQIKPRTSKKRIANIMGDNPNIDTGGLLDAISTVGFLEDDGYMSALPTPPEKSKGVKRDYLEANKLRNFANIGRTEPEQELIIKALIKDIEDAF